MKTQKYIRKGYVRKAKSRKTRPAKLFKQQTLWTHQQMDNMRQTQPF